MINNLHPFHVEVLILISSPATRIRMVRTKMRMVMAKESVMSGYRWHASKQALCHDWTYLRGCTILFRLSTCRNYLDLGCVAPLTLKKALIPWVWERLCRSVHGVEKRCSIAQGHFLSEMFICVLLSRFVVSCITRAHPRSHTDTHTHWHARTYTVTYTRWLIFTCAPSSLPGCSTHYTYAATDHSRRYWLHTLSTMCRCSWPTVNQQNNLPQSPPLDL